MNQYRFAIVFFSLGLWQIERGQSKTDLLEEFKGNSNVSKPTGINEMLKEIVYAGGEPFNVPLKYYEIIKDKNLRYGKDISN